jgi:hypothetical protein
MISHRDMLRFKLCLLARKTPAKKLRYGEGEKRVEWRAEKARHAPRGIDHDQAKDARAVGAAGGSRRGSARRPAFCGSLRLLKQRRLPIASLEPLEAMRVSELLGLLSERGIACKDCKGAEKREIVEQVKAALARPVCWRTVGNGGGGHLLYRARQHGGRIPQQRPIRPSARTAARG